MWFHTQFCSGRDCREKEPVCVNPYPPVPFREGYRYPIVFPEPKAACDSMGIRPTTIGYQFQVKLILKGWCQVRGLILYAIPHSEPQYHGIACNTPTMAKIKPSPVIPIPPPVPPAPPCVLPAKATTPNPANGASSVDPSAVILTWANGGGATSFNVFVNGTFNSNVASPALLLGVLLPLTPYTWRIDSVNACGTTTGDTWSFTTAAFLFSMEDFEEYAAPVALNGLNGGTGWNGAWISS
jgi:hypothetical protein